MSASVTPYFDRLHTYRTARRDQPKKAAGWQDGFLYSQDKAKFPPKLCAYIAAGIASYLRDHGHLAGAAPPDSRVSSAPPPPPSDATAADSSAALPRRLSRASVCIVPT
eukprot:5291474-Prymnesium_polylepis.1